MNATTLQSVESVIAGVEPGKAGDEPSARYELITPERARMDLERNRSNRTLHATRILEYARDMLAGKWDALCGETLKYFADGWLADGQHRLRIMRLHEVMRVTSLSSVTIWRFINAQKFPPARHLGANSIGWIASEVEAWITALPTRISVPHLRSARGNAPLRKRRLRCVPT